MILYDLTPRSSLPIWTKTFQKYLVEIPDFESNNVNSNYEY